MQEIADKDLIDAFIRERVEWQQSLDKTYHPNAGFVNANGLDKALLLVNSVISPERIQIINLLRKHNRLTRKGLHEQTGFSKARFNAAMFTMVRSGLVGFRRIDKKSYCFLNGELVDRLNKAFAGASVFKRKRETYQKWARNQKDS